jgi:hypothetical protein
MAFGAISAAPAAPLRAVYAGVVAPEPELLTTINGLRAAIDAGLKAKHEADREAAYTAVAAFIGTDLRGFSRGLDPLARWNRLEPQEGGLAELVNQLVEQGDLPEGAPAPDLRPQLLQQMHDILRRDVPLGRLPEYRSAVCLPARYAFDSHKVGLFAAAHDADAHALRLHPTSVQLRAEPRPDAAITAAIPARTLLAVEYEKGQPDGWGRYWLSDGRRGWLPDRPDATGLSQQHLCFARQDGAYRITGYFTYGL